MPVDLAKPLEWTKADHVNQRMLDALQGNILKGHGRASTLNIFFQIDPLKKREMRAALRELGNYHVTTAYAQLQETERFKQTGQPGQTFVSVVLSAKGYNALGVPAAQTPADASFAGGMKAAGPALFDPAPATWDEGFKGQIDGMVLIADDDNTNLCSKRDAVVNLLVTDGGGTILQEQAGKQIFNDTHEGIEHFGYVDGRSQPLLLVEALEQEAKTGGISRWDPRSNLGVALVPEPGAADGISFGSYFIFRKLEQNVLGFKRQEQLLADTLGLTGEDRELAGALVVGRFEDGTPVTMSSEARGLTPPNNFNYDGDPGTRCPFHAHIRKTNPRGTGGAEPPAAEFAHQMARRGITYEDVPRTTHPTNIPESSSVADFDANVAPLLPSGGVGLLFMAYNNVIANQFEFMQKLWANNPGFPIGPPPPPGIDPVIGQSGAPPVPHNWPKKWDDAAGGTASLPFQDFVKLKGGEYFFAPSLNFLRNL